MIQKILSSRQEITNIIFRYDNAPHHPEVKTHPHHKHLFDRISDSSHPDIEAVIKEVKERFMK